MHSIYRFYAADDTLLYVGRSKNPFQRLSGHFCDKQMDLVRHIELEWFSTHDDAVRAESLAIYREKPLWNIASPIKQRKARVTRLANVKRPTPPLPRPVRSAPKCYTDMGPRLPPMHGPPLPCKQYAVDVEVDSIGVDVDFVFIGGADAIRRAFKVARRGDVVHLKRGAISMFRVNCAGATSEVPYVQFH